MLLKDSMTLRPRYGEVDQMGYVYHGNYVSYCHQARTEFLRNLGLEDAMIEARGLMMPVISFHIDYKKPSSYDEELVIEVSIGELPTIKFSFDFVVRNIAGELKSKASSTVVFVDKETRQPQRVPSFVRETLERACLVGDG